MFRCVRGEGEVWADRTFLHCPTDNDGSITGSLMKQSLGRRDEKPRTMVASRHGAGSPGGREEREPGGWGARAVAAKHRALPTAKPHEGCARRGRTQWDPRGAHDHGAHGQRCGMPCRAPRLGAAARWGHRALPPCRTRGAHTTGPRNRARAVRTRCDRTTGCGRGCAECARQMDRAAAI